MSTEDFERITKFADAAQSMLDIKKDVFVYIDNNDIGEPDGYHDFRDDAHHIQFNKAEHLPTLAHEFIHASQTERGDLRIDDQGNHFWKGKLNTDRYINQPWEIEAFDLQGQLATAIIIGSNL